MDIRDLRNMLEDLNLPALWEEHSAKITVAASAVVVLSLALVLLRCGGGGGTTRVSNQQYFFDLNTGQLVAGPGHLTGPVDLGGGAFDYPDGRFGSAVEATVVSCNDCAGVESGMTPADLKAVDATLAYLSRYPPGVREILIKIQTGDAVSPEEHNLLGTMEQLYATPEGKTWLPAMSGPATQLVTRAFDGCGEERAQKCAP